MKLEAPSLIGGAIAVCVGLGLAGAAVPAAAPTRDFAGPVVATPPVASARQRRERFNKRVLEMLEAGEGSRLTDVPLPSGRASGSSTGQAGSVSSRASAPVGVPASTTQTLPSRTITVTMAETPSQTIAAALARPDNPIDCLTQAIYYEARSESEEGQAAVAEVILNRARSGRYPAGVCDVVYQRNSRTCQFSYTCDGSIGRTRINAQSWARAQRIARDVYTGRSQALLPARSVNYHANYVSPGWGRRLERVRQIGAHVFYGAPLGGGGAGAYADEARQIPSQSQLVFARLGALDNAYAQFQASLQSTAEVTAPQASAAVPD